VKRYGLVRCVLGMRILAGDRGATAAEYALIASLIAVVIVIAVTLLGQNTLALFNDAASSVSDAAG